eukprot:TRINITY_DN12609_c0_g1_i1.p1 TRINITY_DN12609_c0_g1~~TRINITY_DN12609_c0_g1_i1.p1  ORF type:complete len:286 (-),score=64.72 TRINITY_DN12609_c0_g1_i1:108-965(-)
MSNLKELSSAKIFGGWTKRFSHHSDVLNCDMNFSVFLPSGSADATKRFPVLYWLSGLTCTDENFITKAGAQRAAEQHGIILIAPDTSPRGVQIEGMSDSWDFGLGAGFYLNATEEKWSKHFNMYDYITKELPTLVNGALPVDPARQAISGHSMGGHGALVIALKNPGRYKSVSAFAPICNPVNCPWGVKAFTGYLGENREAWKQYDATELAKTLDATVADSYHILIDQGSADKFLENQLLPKNFTDVAAQKGLHVEYREQKDYDHSYYFISTFFDDHVAFHAKRL